MRMFASQDRGRFGTLGIALTLAACALVPSRAQAQQYYAPPPEEYYTDDRVRFTIEGQLGGVVGGVGALGGGTAISIGLQMNDIVAAYATHRILGARPIDSSGSYAASFNAFVLELTVFDRFQLGAGPSLDVGIDGLCSPNEPQCGGLSNLRFGLETRLAVVLGERTPARRRGLSIAVTVHPTWVDRNNSVTTIMLGIGYALF
ncbi:MAG: hypothetical protein M3Y87_01090 [Myxococcota bacterium]|nr:hypothetical protein [Myxococcota bacterium]